MTTAYDVITDRITGMLEAGTVPWRRPWHAQVGAPRNLTSRKAYRGVNVFLLGSLGYESPYFLTFKQAKARGGHVSKGERGCPVVFWKWLDARKAVDEETGEMVTTYKRTPLLRYYTVFNVEQCDGLENVPAVEVPTREHSPIEAAERITDGMPLRPEIRHIGGQACYNPLSDVVRIPQEGRFEAGQAYYATLFHELAHSTGHSSRLDRKLDTELAAFGSPDYSREELVAEMTAAYLCGEAGILDTQIEQSAAYINGWLRRLRDDRRLVVTAAAAAQRATDFILRREWSEAA